MSDLREHLVADALKFGATRAAILGMARVRFYPEVRRLCERNACGMYGKNWTCPPGVGSLEELSARARQFAHGLLFQTVFPLEDSFDLEGMGRAAKEQRRIVRQLSEHLAACYPFRKMLTLGSGPCDICKECTLPKNEPCRFPDRAISSPEAYGMNVKEIVESCGFSYINGKNTVSYVGLILYDDGGS